MTIPGTLSTPTAGPILCPGAPVICAYADAGYRLPGEVTRAIVGRRYRDDWDVHAHEGWVSAGPVALSLDLESDLGPTIALRWLGRHYGIDVGIGCPEWSRFGGASPVWCLHTAKIDLWFASGGRSAVDRCATNIFGVPGISAITDPLEALVAACVHAAGVPRE